MITDNNFKCGDEVFINKIYMSPYINAPYIDTPATIICEWMPRIYMLELKNHIAGFTHPYEHNDITYDNTRFVPSVFIIPCDENKFKVDLI